MLFYAAAALLMVGAILQIAANRLVDRGAVGPGAAVRMWAYAVLLLAAPAMAVGSLLSEQPVVLKALVCASDVLLLWILVVALRRMPRTRSGAEETSPHRP
ncbi:hypothetical protein [Nocardia sp. IFM 10818]